MAMKRLQNTNVHIADDVAALLTTSAIAQLRSPAYRDAYQCQACGRQASIATNGANVLAFATNTKQVTAVSLAHPTCTPSMVIPIDEVPNDLLDDQEDVDTNWFLDPHGYAWVLWEWKPLNVSSEDDPDGHDFGLALYAEMGLARLAGEVGKHMANLARSVPKPAGWTATVADGYLDIRDPGGEIALATDIPSPQWLAAAKAKRTVVVGAGINMRLDILHQGTDRLNDAIANGTVLAGRIPLR